MTEPRRISRQTLVGVGLVLVIIVSVLVARNGRQRQLRERAARVPALRDTIRQNWEPDVDSTISLVGRVLRSNGDETVYIAVGSDLSTRGRNCRRRLADEEPNYRIAYGDSAYRDFHEYCVGYWTLGLMLMTKPPRSDVDSLATAVVAAGRTVKQTFTATPVD
jgi:hypothetical protein